MHSRKIEVSKQYDGRFQKNFSSLNELINNAFTTNNAWDILELPKHVFRRNKYKITIVTCCFGIQDKRLIIYNTFSNKLKYIKKTKQ